MKIWPTAMEDIGKTRCGTSLSETMVYYTISRVFIDRCARVGEFQVMVRERERMDDCND